MTIHAGSIILLIFFGGLMVFGWHLFTSKSYLQNSTRRQKEMGREFIAQIQETGCYAIYVKLIGAVLFLGSGFMIIAFIVHNFF
jgi:hypothetical protein